MDDGAQLSVVVPLYNEAQNIAPLVTAVQDALEERYDWELILVDDGSSDGTVDVAERHTRDDDRVRLLRLTRNYGQTTAMQAGFDHARGKIVVSMDGDMQNDPRDIPRLTEKLDEGWDLVAGYREDRKDRLLTRKIPSRVANGIIRWITGVDIRDNGCSLKAYRGEMLRELHLYSDQHRFIPALAAATARARITEMPVRHHPRRFGTSKYGLSRIWKVLADLLSVTMIRWFRERPLLMFGWSAAGSMAVGAVFAVAATVTAATIMVEGATAIVFTGSSLLFVGLAGFLLMLGLVGEVALYWRRVGAGSSPEGET